MLRPSIPPPCVILNAGHPVLRRRARRHPVFEGRSHLEERRRRENLAAEEPPLPLAKASCCRVKRACRERNGHANVFRMLNPLCRSHVPLSTLRKNLSVAITSSICHPKGPSRNLVVGVFGMPHSRFAEP